MFIKKDKHIILCENILNKRSKETPPELYTSDLLQAHFTTQFHSFLLSLKFLGQLDMTDLSYSKYCYVHRFFCTGSLLCHWIDAGKETIPLLQVIKLVRNFITEVWNYKYWKDNSSIFKIDTISLLVCVQKECFCQNAFFVNFPSNLKKRCNQNLCR